MPTSAEFAPVRYGNAPTVDHVRISPAGDRVLAIVSGAGKRGVAVINLSGGPPTVALQPDPAGRHLDACDWASNDRLVCSMFVFQNRGDGPPYPRRRKLRLVAVDHDGGNPRPLLSRRPRDAPKVAGVSTPPVRHPYEDLEHEVVHYLPWDSDHVLVRAPREADAYTTVYRVHTRNGAATKVAGFEFGITLWHADWQGRLRVGTGWYEYGSALPPVGGRRPDEPWVGPTAIAADATGRLRRVDVSDLSAPIGRHDLAGPHILGFSKDGAHLYYEARVDGADRTAVWEANARTLAPLRQVVADPERDVRATAIGGQECGIVGFMHPLPGRPFTWLNAAFARDMASAEAHLPADAVAVTSVSANCQRLVLAVTDHRILKSFHLLDRTSGALQNLGEQFPWTDGEGGRSERRSVRFATRDGLHLPMTLTLPTERGAKPPPVVVLLDGTPGPDSASALNTWPHFFASRGYVVAQPVARGTRGYGAAHAINGLRDGGAKLQTDVADALAWLSTTGLGDGRRACFAGRGRGGHLALAAALATPADGSGGVEGRCVAVYGPRNIRYTKRDQHGPYRDCWLYPCNDRTRWEAPHYVQGRNGADGADARRRLSVDGDEAPFDMQHSPLAAMPHPGFPILIKGDGMGMVHEEESRRFHRDVREIQVFERIAPVGSDAEAEFLAEAQALFAEVLDVADDREPPR